MILEAERLVVLGFPHQQAQGQEPLYACDSLLLMQQEIHAQGAI